MTSDSYAQTNLLKPSTNTITTPTFLGSDVISSIPQQEKINVFNNTSYSQSANAVKLLPYITNNNGKIRLYTEINSNIKVGDVVYIMYDPSGSTTGLTDAIIMDNYLEFLSCENYIYLPQLQGYSVIETNDKNNEITIDRYYDSRFPNKKIYSHYIAKIYVRNISLNGGEIDGVEILNGNFNNGSDVALDINLVQAVVLSGSSFYIRYKDKYDSLYITTNSSINSGTTSSVYRPYIYQGKETLNQDPTPSSSYFTNNNNEYGYNYIYFNKLRECEINSGYYYNCILLDCDISGGYFTNCSISGSTIKGGVFYESPIDSNCLWLYGTWSGGTFPLQVWYNGIWNGGDFIGKDWRDGIFNDGFFSGSTWRTGLFQGGTMINSVWSGGTFGGGWMEKTEWVDGWFNDGTMYQGTWANGVCNGGKLQNMIWRNGVFNRGDFISGSWYNGIFNDGSMSDTYWENGTFNGGKFISSFNLPSISGGTYTSSIVPIAGQNVLDLNEIENYTKVKYWKDGIFNGGIFSNSLWSGGTFYDGTFTDNSLWLNGTFYYGNFTNSNWVLGEWKNGTVTNSYFHNVNWKSGIWNGGTLGVRLSGTTSLVKTIYPSVTWWGGTFNNGIFGYGGTNADQNVIWYSGDFYNGTFYTAFQDCNTGILGGFYGGAFWDGYFYGVFWKGIWINGKFGPGACNKAGILTEKTVKTKKQKIISKKFGEQPIKTKQMGIGNSNNFIR